MRATAFSPLLFTLVCLATLLSGCEMVGSAGESFNKWAHENIKSKGDDKAANNNPATPASQNLQAPSDPNCPQVTVIGELGSITQFTVPNKPADQNMISSAKLHGVNSTCQTSANSVTLEISLDFSGELGPIGVKDLNGQANYTYPYFLSVITPSGQILSKDVFALSMAFDKNNMSIAKQDKLRQIIPLSVGQNAAQFQIIAGFQLSADELAYNRAQPPKN